MTGQQRTYAYAGGAAVILLLLYRYIHANSQAAGQAAGTQTGAVDPGAATSSDFAALAGQEQSDAAALQQQHQQLLATEQSDVQTLTTAQQQLQAQESGDVQALQANETSNVQTLMAQIAASASQAASAAVNAVAPQVHQVTQDVARVSSGQQAINRSLANLTTSANLRWLAPGAKNPTYVLVPPKNAPSSARWSNRRPAGKWRGIGGGWWVPTR